MDQDKSEAINHAPVFNTKTYHVGAAIYVKTPQNERFNAIICDSGYEYIQCYHLDNISFKPIFDS